MVQPRATSRTSAREWRCPRCGSPLGHVTGSGDLIVTAVSSLVELSRVTVVVRCGCGAAKAFDGQRVIVRKVGVVSNGS
jgi:hypothetical protein